MKAMILAAGIGSRLRPLTDTTPKCLASAGGRSMLEHTILRLKAAGVTEVVINLHHFPEKVRKFVADHQSFGIKVDFSEERELLDTGGGLKRAAKFLRGDQPFILHNSDVYTDFALIEMVKFHKSKNSLATLLVLDRSSDRTLLFSDKMELVGHENKKSGVKKLVQNVAKEKDFSFCGIHIISPRIFDRMNSQGEKFSIIDTYLKASKSGEKILGYELSQGFWIDIGTAEKLSTLDKRLNSGK